MGCLIPRPKHSKLYGQRRAAPQCRPPALIIANACLSARTSEQLESGELARVDRRELALLPSLADAFFKQGVRNYIGTSWEVDDAGAVLFARVLYEQMIGKGAKLGTAVRRARRRLWDRRGVDDLGNLWAAYQHYGDPNDDRLTRAGA